MPRKKPRPKLYWVETDDHDEDCVVVVRCARNARRNARDPRGLHYTQGDAYSTLLLSLEEGLCRARQPDTTRSVVAGGSVDGR